MIWSTKILVLLLSHQGLLETSAIYDAKANLWLGGLSSLPSPETRLLGAVAPLFHNSPPDISHGDGIFVSYENTCGAYRVRRQGLERVLQIRHLVSPPGYKLVKLDVTGTRIQQCMAVVTCDNHLDATRRSKIRVHPLSYGYSARDGCIRGRSASKLCGGWGAGPWQKMKWMFRCRGRTHICTYLAIRQTVQPLHFCSL